MRMITTNEASKLWGITTRRITKLASQGRIPGAKNIDNRWFIPESAPKPFDGRKTNTDSHASDTFIFPNIPCTICFEHPVEELSDEEKQLFDAYMQYENGDFDRSMHSAAKVLSNTGNIYIRIGALYILVFLFIMQRRYEDAYRTLSECMDACLESEAHKEELSLFMFELECFTPSKQWLYQPFSVCDYKLSTPFDMAYASYLSILQAIASTLEQKHPIDVNMYELAVKRIESEGYYCLSLYCHAVLSSLYALNGLGDLEYIHLKRAFDIAIENHLYGSISCLTYQMPDISYKVLNEYPAAIRKKLQGLMELNMSAYSEFQSYYIRNKLFSKLSLHDRRLISYCLRDYTINQMAEMDDISLSKAKRQLVSLYKKLGVNGKAELIGLVKSMLLHGKEEP